ncbi:hypothetical protein ABIE27_002273 [Paenibacillus sp. 4624]
MLGYDDAATCAVCGVYNTKYEVKYMNSFMTERRMNLWRMHS